MIKDILRKITPKWFRRKYYRFKLKKIILKYYNGKNLPQDKEEIIEYLKKNSLHVYPYHFRKKYLVKDSPKVEMDNTNNMYYIILNDGKRLYFKKGLSEKKAKSFYLDMRMEQDEQSPHRYNTESFKINEGDVVCDVGTCEGLWLLLNIEKIKKAYVFEYNPEWVEALKKTFEPWEEKVEIIAKFVSGTQGGNTVTLDKTLNPNSSNPIDFLKLDVEGAERDVLKGAMNLLSSKSILKIAVCTYHRADDEEVLQNILSEYGFNICFSNGYMIFHDDPEIAPPYFRKALIRATLN